MKCVICQERELANGQVCQRCEHRETDRLADIARWHQILPEMLQPGSSGGPKVSGTREAPLPLRVDPLDLMGPVHVAHITAYFEDQIGEVAAATVLDSWVRDWIDTRNRGENLPVPTVAVLANWLTMRLDWACLEHPAIDEYSGEIYVLWLAMRTAVGEQPPRKEPCLGIPCPKPECDQRALYRENDGTGDVRCGACRNVLDADEYQRWYRMLAANAKEMSAA